MKSNTKVKNIKLSMGVFVKCPHPEIIESLSLSGMDFAVIDMEHVFATQAQLYSLKLAADFRKFDLIVRIPSNTEEYFKWCLDLGYQYIQVPFVQSRDCAEKAIKMSHFSPKGERGLCRFVRAADFSISEKSEYIKKSNENVKLIFQIEGKKGFDNLDDILESEGYYAIFVGPYDLSQSLGLPGDIWNAKVLEVMQKIIEKCKKRGVKVGTFTDSPAGINHWSKAGVDFIEYASDLAILINGYNSLLKESQL